MPAKTPDLNFSPQGLFIGGEWVTSRSGQTITTINPSNGDPLGEVPLANQADVDAAVAAAVAPAALPALAAAGGPAAGPAQRLGCSVQRLIRESNTCCRKPPKFDAISPIQSK